MTFAEMMELKPTPEKQFEAGSAGGTLQSPFSGWPIEALEFKHDATVTGSAATIASNGAYRMATKRLQLTQDEQPLVDIAGPELFYLSSLMSGGRDNSSNTASLGTFFSRLDFNALMPGALIDASSGGAQVFVRTEYGSLTDYAQTAPDTYSGVNRPSMIRSPNDPRVGYKRPHIRSATVDLSTAGQDIPYTLSISSDQWVLGCLVRAVDADGGYNGRETDGLVRSMRAYMTGGSIARSELIRARWGTLRERTVKQANMAFGDRAIMGGVAWIPFQSRDPEALANFNGATFFSRNDSLELHFDNQTTVERNYTAVTPAAGDHVVVTVVAFEWVDPVIGDPNAGRRRVVPNTVVSSPPAVAGSARVSRL